MYNHFQWCHIFTNSDRKLAFQIGGRISVEFCKWLIVIEQNDLIQCQTSVFMFSALGFYLFPTFSCPIIKERKLSESCIRIKDPKGYIASLLCQKFMDHVWLFSIDVIYLLSLTITIGWKSHENYQHCPVNMSGFAFGIFCLCLVYPLSQHKT